MILSLLYLVQFPLVPYLSENISIEIVFILIHYNLKKMHLHFLLKLRVLQFLGKFSFTMLLLLPELC